MPATFRVPVGTVPIILFSIIRPLRAFTDRGIMIRMVSTIRRRLILETAELSLTLLMTQPVIEAFNVTKRFPDGTVALQDVTWSVLQGETMVLIGESGSGKTTLLRLLNRLDEPTSGEIRIHGRPVREQDPISLRRSLGYVQQEGGLLPHWTVSDNVTLVPRLLGWPESQRRERAEVLLDLVGLPLPQFGQRYPIELSGGQRQRVAFARALAADPAIVLLDEPFGALDALTRLALQKEFLHLQRHLTKTMVLVTHDLYEAFRLGTRVAVMKDGRILQIGTPSELKRHPTHDYVRQLIEHVFVSV
ncbi:MAG: ATP-binding cassette domain-containing protein [Nitrospirae bacterium]|nr:MAG: ATP-binding cassette domain-containing protein [Nitrospirota bacterium]